MAIKYVACAAVPLLIAALPTQAVTLEQLNQQVQQMNQRIAQQDQKLRINGFASFGMSLGSEEIEYNGVNDESNFGRFSKVGVQMSFNMDANNSVVTQLVSRGENEWNTEAEWAYFKHNFGSGFSSKIGRIRLPAFMLSEFLDVGYAVPWAKMPNETYNSLTPFANMDGVDLTYNTDIGDMSATFQVAYGRSKDDEYDIKSVIATNAMLQGDTWTARIAYSLSDDINVIDADIQGVVNGLYGSDVAKVKGSFTSIGFTYDPGNIYFITEYARLEVDGAIVDADSAYATFGYRMGQFMPLITYAMTTSEDDDERDLQVIADKLTGGNLAALAAVDVSGGTSPTDSTASPYENPSLNLAGRAFQAENNRDTTRIGLGLRYDMASGTALKVQYDIIDTGDKAGMFDSRAFAAAGSSAPDSTNILTITIDTVF
jgi:hypothetical protein